MSLSGRNAVVTGAARGIGRAIAMRLARDGAAVSAWDIDANGVAETARLIRVADGHATSWCGDCAQAADIARAVEHTHGEIGPITILVNNAAISPFVRWSDLTEELWDELIAIDLKGPFLCCKAVIPDMLEAGWGRIVNISSSAAQQGGPMSAHYSAAKAGIIGLTKTLAMEFAGTGITANAVPPCKIETERLHEAPVDLAIAASLSPMKRLGRPENIAAAVSFLASEDADYITGHTLSVNGGSYLN